MPQTICSKCQAKLTPDQRRHGQFLCDRCEAAWKNQHGERGGTAPQPATSRPLPHDPTTS